MNEKSQKTLTMGLNLNAELNNNRTNRASHLCYKSFRATKYCIAKPKQGDSLWDNTLTLLSARVDG